jgi:hypothetical protein
MAKENGAFLAVCIDGYENWWDLDFKLIVFDQNSRAMLRHNDDSYKYQVRPVILGLAGRNASRISPAVSSK